MDLDEAEEGPVAPRDALQVHVVLAVPAAKQSTRIRVVGGECMHMPVRAIYISIDAQAGERTRQPISKAADAPHLRIASRTPQATHRTPQTNHIIGWCKGSETGWGAG